MNNLGNEAGRNLDTSGEQSNIIKMDINTTGRFIWLKLICRALSG
jgi:hypothetical protein